MSQTRLWRLPLYRHFAAYRQRRLISRELMRRRKMKSRIFRLRLRKYFAARARPRR